MVLSMRIDRVNDRIFTPGPEERCLYANLAIGQHEILQRNSATVAKRQTSQTFVITDRALHRHRGDRSPLFDQAGLDVRKQ